MTATYWRSRWCDDHDHSDDDDDGACVVVVVVDDDDDGGGGGGDDRDDDDDDDDNDDDDDDNDDNDTVYIVMVKLIVLMMVSTIQNLKRVRYSDPTYAHTRTWTHAQDNLPHSQQEPITISPQVTSSLHYQGNTAVSDIIPANK